MDVADIKKQSLSSLVADFQICQHCRIVDRDQARIRYGYMCQTCGTPGAGGHMYFEISVHLLVDLMQEAFQTPSSIESGGPSDSKAHNVSVVLFFCTLREITLNWLIKHLCSAQEIPYPIVKRLLADNNTHLLRMNNLLPSLVGKKWKILIDEETKASKFDYAELNEFLKKAVGARNKFMHEGKQWGIDRNLAEGCVEHILPLLNFHALLHNRYAHPHHHAQTG